MLRVFAAGEGMTLFTAVASTVNVTFLQRELLSRWVGSLSNEVVVSAETTAQNRIAKTHAGISDLNSLLKNIFLFVMRFVGSISAPEKSWFLAIQSKIALMSNS